MYLRAAAHESRTMAAHVRSQRNRYLRAVARMAIAHWADESDGIREV